MLLPAARVTGSGRARGGPPGSTGAGRARGGPPGSPGPGGQPAASLRVCGRVFPRRRGLAPIGFRLMGLAVGQAALVIGPSGLVVLIEELGGFLVHLRGLVVDGGGMLMCGGTPALMPAVLAVGFAHNPRLSHDVP